MLSRLFHRRASRSMPLLVCAVALSTACGSTVATGPGGQVAGAAPGQDGTLVQDPTLSAQDPTLSAPAGDGLGDGGLGDGGLGDGGLGDGGLVVPGATTGSAAPNGGGATTGGSTGGSSGSTGGGTAAAPGSAQSGAAGSSGGAAGQSAAGGFPAKGRGYDEKTLLIGVGLQRSASESGKAIGLPPVATGNQQRQAEAVIADINARGGILGRKIKPVFHEMTNEEWNSSRSGAQQRACATWTQDNQVFAAISTSGNFQYGNSPIYECMAKKDTPFLFADNVPRERKLYERYPSHLYTPGNATIDRYGPGLARALSDQKYFDKWDAKTGSPGTAPVKIGVLHTSDEPGLPAIYKPALNAVGQRDLLFYELEAKSAQSIAAAVGAAVLKFASEGVTHVITNGALLFFAPAANSQGYRPRLGVTTWDALNATATAVPAESLKGSLGAGYLPHLDVTQAHAPKDVTPQETRCKEVMEKGGQNASDRTTLYSMLTICEDLWLIEDSLKRGGALTTPAMRAGVEAQNQPVASGLSFAIRYGPRQHDGAHAVRDLAYIDGAFRYTSGNRPLG